MSPFFIFNNLSFAEQIFGFLVFAMTAWLAFDSYAIRKDFLTASRGIGFALLALSQVATAFSFGIETYEYLGHIVRIIGLVLVFWNLVLEKPVERPSLNAVLLLPPLASAVMYFSFWDTVLFFGIAFLSYRQYKKEDKKSLISFIYAFSLLTVSSIFSFFYTTGHFDFYWITGHLFEIAGFIFLAVWVWQYMQLRLREELLLIFFSVALFISIIVTLAFSMILISQIELSVSNNLATNSRTIDYLVIHLKEESLSKARLFASNVDLRESLLKSDFSKIEKISNTFMETENLGFLTIADKDGNVILRSQSIAKRTDNILKEKAIIKATEGFSVATIEPTPVEKFSIRSASPIIMQNGALIGYVLTGFILDSTFTDSIKKITGLDITIFDNDMVVASTITGVDGRTRIEGTKLNNEEVFAEVLSKGVPMTIRADIITKPYVASYMPLKNIDDETVGMISLAKSQREIFEIANDTNILTLISVIIIMALLSMPIFRFTKRLIEY